MLDPRHSKNQEDGGMTDQPLVIYHKDCLDGIASAWCFWDYYQGAVELFAAQYGDVAPPEELVSGRAVFIVDFSYELDTLLAMCEVAESVTVLDHHESGVHGLMGDVSMQEQAQPGNLHLILDITKAGCILAWEYLYGAHILAPDILVAIADRDLWIFDHEDTRAICAALYSYPLTVQLLEIYLQDPLGAIALKAQGDPLLRQEANQIAKLLPAASFGSEFGPLIPVVNAPMFLASELGATLLLDNPLAPFAVIYTRLATNWKISLRSRKEDEDTNVAEIAERFGGGGHKSAAGYYLTDAQMRERQL